MALMLDPIEEKKRAIRNKTLLGRAGTMERDPNTVATVQPILPAYAMQPDTQFGFNQPVPARANPGSPAPGTSSRDQIPAGTPDVSRGTIPNQPVPVGPTARVSTNPNVRYTGSNSPEKDRATAELGDERDTIRDDLFRVSALIRQATASGDHERARALQQEFSAGRSVRRQIESTGRDIALSKERSFVTPEGAKVSHDRLEADLQSPGRQAEIIQRKQAVAEADARRSQGFRYQPPDQPLADPLNNAMRNDARLFNSLSPITNPDANAPDADQITNQFQIDRKRQADVENAGKLAAKARASPPSMGAPTDPAAINSRFEQSQTDAVGNEKTAADSIAKRQAALSAQEKLKAGEQTLAVENQNADILQAKARGTGTDTASEIARLKGTADVTNQRRITEGVVSKPFDDQSKILTADIIGNVTGAIEGDERSKANVAGALSQLSEQWAGMSQEQQTAIQYQLTKQANDLEASQPGIASRIFEWVGVIAPFLVPVGPLVQGAAIGTLPLPVDAAAKRQTIKELQDKLRAQKAISR